MTQPDPAGIFRQEAAEVLESLEAALLDLGDRFEDRALVDTVFRALHTLKGSGAMFGFTEVADFVHDFETAFDRVRKGVVVPNDKLVLVSLAAKAMGFSPIRSFFSISAISETYRHIPAAPTFSRLA